MKYPVTDVHPRRQLKGVDVIHHGGLLGTLLLLAAADNRFNPVFVRQFSPNRWFGIVIQIRVILDKVSHGGFTLL